MYVKQLYSHSFCAELVVLPDGYEGVRAPAHEKLNTARADAHIFANVCMCIRRPDCLVIYTSMNLRAWLRKHTCLVADIYANMHVLRVHARVRLSMMLICCTCTHVHTHVSVHTHTRIYVYTHTRMFTHAHIHACLHAHTHVCFPHILCSHAARPVLFPMYNSPPCLLAYTCACRSRHTQRFHAAMQSKPRTIPHCCAVCAVLYVLCCCAVYVLCCCAVCTTTCS